MAKGKAIFDYTVCMRCTACIYTCPLGCIVKVDIPKNKQVDSAPSLMKDTCCTGCGICAKACPVDAIKIELYSLT